MAVGEGMNLNQALVVLGEQTLKIRLLEDERDTLRHQLTEAGLVIQDLHARIEHGEGGDNGHVHEAHREADAA